MDFVEIAQIVLAALMSLAGFPALLSVVMTALEYFGIIAAEMADAINFWSNAAVFVGIFALAVTGRIDLLTQIDEALGQIAAILTQILILIGVPLGFAITKAVHGQIRKASFLAHRIR